MTAFEETIWRGMVNTTLAEVEHSDEAHRFNAYMVWYDSAPQPTQEGE